MLESVESIGSQASLEDEQTIQARPNIGIEDVRKFED